MAENLLLEGCNEKLRTIHSQLEKINNSFNYKVNSFIKI